MIVLDTNVVSELMRPDPAPVVAQWVRARRGRELCTTSVTLAEIRFGIVRLPAGRRRDLLAATADELFTGFGDQILPFDAAAAERYALIVVRREQLGTPIDGFDAQIAAIGATRAAPIATRNVADFRDTGVEIIDPWDSAEPLPGVHGDRVAQVPGQAGSGGVDVRGEPLVVDV